MADAGVPNIWSIHADDNTRARRDRDGYRRRLFGNLPQLDVFTNLLKGLWVICFESYTRTVDVHDGNRVHYREELELVHPRVVVHERIRISSAASTLNEEELPLQL